MKVEPILSKKSTPTYYIDCSTVLPATIDKLVQTIKKEGQLLFISSPFFGRPEAAARGQVGTNNNNYYYDYYGILTFSFS